MPARSGWFTWFFRYFNRAFDFCRAKYEGIVGRSFGKPVRYLVVYGAIVTAMVLLLPPSPHLVPAGRGPGIPALPAPAPRRRHHGTDPQSVKTDGAVLSGGGEKDGGRVSSPWPGSALPDVARTWGLHGSSSRTGMCARPADLKVAGDCGTGNEGVLANPGRPRLCLSPPAVLELGGPTALTSSFRTVADLGTRS